MHNKTIVLASANAHKVAEIVEIFNALMPEWTLLPRPSLDEVGDVDEKADTLVGNAQLKALTVMHATGLPALADDTGLFVDALGGAPGVRSARYAADADFMAGTADKDHANRALLLEKMHGVNDRRAEFRSVMVIAVPNASDINPTWIMGQGVLRGEISTVERGSNGFGYDAVFIPEGGAITYAEMDSVTKNSISHRRRAVEALIAAMTK